MTINLGLNTDAIQDAKQHTIFILCLLYLSISVSYTYAKTFGSTLEGYSLTSRCTMNASEL